MNIKCKLKFDKGKFNSLIEDATESFLSMEQDQIRDTLIDLDEGDYESYLEDCISYILICYDLTYIEEIK